jgi:hypothetical protein
MERPLLIGGIVGPVQFTLVYLVEGATRPGYDAVRDAVSALSLTDRGWVDGASLVVNGLLHGNVHFFVGATATFTGLIGGCAVFASSFRHDPAWRGWPSFLLVSVLATAAGFVGFAYAASHSGPGGLFERLAFTAGMLWIVVLAVRLLPRADA